LEEGEVVAFLPVEGTRTTPVSSLPEGMRLIEVPPAELAIMVHSGTLHDLDRTYGALGTEVNDRRIGLDGPIREYYLVSPLDTDDEDAHRTEVAWPVFRAGQPLS
jgi:effector-binding domain-containing protein